MKKLLLLLSLFFPTYVFAAPQDIYYSIRGKCSAEDHKIMTQAIYEGWRLCDTAVHGRIGEIKLWQTECIFPHHIRFEMDATHVDSKDIHPAEVINGGQVIVYWQYFGQYGVILQSRIMCHELMHLIFHLPDQYKSHWTKHITDIQPHCIMGYAKYDEWTGRLCDACDLKVRKSCEKAHGTKQK